MTLDELNTMSPEDAQAWFATTCSAQRWCHLMADGRPFASLEQLKQLAATHWETMTQDDVLQAFAGHPMIGDIDSLRAKYAHTKALASDEQSGMQHADESTFQQLQKLNHAYVARHGFIFIICATGLSAMQMLAALQGRIDNSTEQERATAAKEQLKITLLRFDKALKESAERA